MPTNGQVPTWNDALDPPFEWADAPGRSARVWKSHVAAICNAMVPGGVTPAAVDPIGTCVATTTKVKAG